MRKLIVCKRGQLAVGNRDVTELETDEAVNQAVAEMKAQFPDADLTWYRHTCGPACIEEVFKPGEIQAVKTEGAGTGAAKKEEPVKKPATKKTSKAK